MGEHGANLCGLKSKFSITLSIKIAFYLENNLFESTGRLLERQKAPDPTRLSFRKVRHTNVRGAFHCPGL